MQNTVSEKDMRKIIDASYNTVLRTLVAETVGIRFKSVHYMSSRRVTDAVVLNLALNAEITPVSADEIIMTLARAERSLYTTIDSAYATVKDKFEEYAKFVLGDDYDRIIGLGMRSANFIVYVISVDLQKDPRINGREVITKAYSYAEITDGKTPHY